MVELDIIHDKNLIKCPFLHSLVSIYQLHHYLITLIGPVGIYIYVGVIGEGGSEGRREMEVKYAACRDKEGYYSVVFCGVSSSQQ